jgi:hypothetical protein
MQGVFLRNYQPEKCLHNLIIEFRFKFNLSLLSSCLLPENLRFNSRGIQYYRLFYEGVNAGLSHLEDNTG